MTKCVCPICGDIHAERGTKALRVLLGRMNDPFSYRVNIFASKKWDTLR